MNVNENQIRRLAIDGATDREICEIHGLRETELRERFGAALIEAQGAAAGFVAEVAKRGGEEGECGNFVVTGEA